LSKVSCILSFTCIDAAEKTAARGGMSGSDTAAGCSSRPSLFIWFFSSEVDLKVARFERGSGGLQWKLPLPPKNVTQKLGHWKQQIFSWWCLLSACSKALCFFALPSLRLLRLRGM
jgi:hypothetical protein